MVKNKIIVEDKKLIPSYSVVIKLCKMAFYADKIAGPKVPEQAHKDIIQKLFSDRELSEFICKIMKEEDIK